MANSVEEREKVHTFMYVYIDEKRGKTWYILIQHVVSLVSFSTKVLL